MQPRVGKRFAVAAFPIAMQIGGQPRQSACHTLGEHMSDSRTAYDGLHEVRHTSRSKVREMAAVAGGTTW